MRGSGGRARPIFDRVVRAGVMVAVVAAGCRGSNGSGGGSGSAKPIASGQEEGPSRGGHVKLPSNEPRYTNPILETRFDMAAGLIFEGLVGVDTKYEPVKRLAESWSLSDDGKVITFKLRQGAVWSDGEKV